jgi:hypothetical protein
MTNLMLGDALASRVRLKGASHAQTCNVSGDVDEAGMTMEPLSLDVIWFPSVFGSLHGIQSLGTEAVSTTDALSGLHKHNILTMK